MNEALVASALFYKNVLALDVIPDHPTAKYPMGIDGWQEKTFTDDELKDKIGKEGWGIGIRNQEGLDFDNVGNPPATELFNQWQELVEAQAPGLVSKLTIETTPRKGYHAVYKCPAIEGNQKLATRPVTPEEKAQDPKKTEITLIETRGKGGQFMVAPSPGYEVIQGGWANLREITPEEREILLDCARALHTPKVEPKRENGKTPTIDGDRPGDIYNRQHTKEALELLQRIGWATVYTKGETTYLRRPGKKQGVSATFNYKDSNLLWVFSSNASPFEMEQSYSPFAIYTTLEHGGDFSSATKSLANRFGLNGHNPTTNTATEAPEENEPEAGESSVSGIQGWQLFTLADAYQERLPLTYAVDPLFSLPSLNMLYSGPGMLKSLLLAEALTCTADGLPWLEPLPGQNVKPFQTISAPVLWVDFDNGKRRTHERFEALARARNLPAALPTLFYTSMPNPWLDASDELAVDALISLINRKKIKLVALDNLGLITGGVDENSPAMIPVMSNLRRLAEETGAAIVVIHHQRKGSGTKGRAGETLRGHSCIEAALDLALLVERKDGSDRVSVKSTKTRDVDVLPFSAEWTYEHKPGTNELAQAKFFGVAGKSSEQLEELQITIIACAKTNPGLSQNKLKETVKAQLPEASLHSIRSEILRMAESGQLKVVDAGDGKASAYYPNEDL